MRQGYRTEMREKVRAIILENGRREAAVGDLCEYMNLDTISPLVQAAIVHAQLETIHPFGDGNGRTGRALIHAILRRRGIAKTFVPPISLVFAAGEGSLHRRSYAVPRRQCRFMDLGFFRRGDASGVVGATLRRGGRDPPGNVERSAPGA
jgi:hypothetical protein